MTDARLPEHWLTLPAFDDLSDRAWRTFTGALMWSNSSGSDGYLPSKALRFLHPQGVDQATADELVSAGHWEGRPNGAYQVSNWSRSQSLAVDVEHQRERNRRNKQAQRDRERQARADTPAPVTAAVSGDIPDDDSEDIGGQARDRRSYEPEFYETSCAECQRRSAFGSPPCPQHRAAS